MKIEKFGDWDKAERILRSGFAARLSKALNKAATRSALLLVREVKRGIVSQSPGGKPFARLASATIERKGSSKALIDTGFLLNAVTQRIMGDKAFVGLLRGTRHVNREELVNIGAVMEFGAVIKMPNGAVITIPARPFLHPVMEKHLEAIKKIYLEAVDELLR